MYDRLNTREVGQRSWQLYTQINLNLYSMTCLTYINLFEIMNGLADDPNPREIWKKYQKYTHIYIKYHRNTLSKASKITKEPTASIQFRSPITSHPSLL